MFLATGSRNLSPVENHCHGAHKTPNICYVACYGQSLPNVELIQCAFCANGKSEALGGMTCPDPPNWVLAARELPLELA